MGCEKDAVASSLDAEESLVALNPDVGMVCANLPGDEEAAAVLPGDEETPAMAWTVSFDAISPRNAM